MKKLNNLIIAILSMVFLVGCKSSYNVPKEPNTKIEKGMLQKNELEAESMIGAYLNFSQGISIWSDNSDEKKDEETKGGVVYQVKTKVGKEYILPKDVPIFYHKGPKKGKPAFNKKTGRFETKSFLAEIISLDRFEKTMWISVDIEEGNSIQLEFTTTQYNGSNFFYLKTLKKSDFADPTEITANRFKIDKFSNVYFIEKGKNMFITADANGTYWYISEADKKVYLYKFLFLKGKDDKSIRNTGKSKEFGQ